MRVVHIVAGLPPGGGISESVPRLCRHLRRLGHEVTIATLDGTMSEAALEAEEAGVRLVRFRASRPRFLFFSWQMLRQLRAVCAEADVAHVHSMWTFPVWWGCRCALRNGKPLVISPRGCLDPVRLTHSAWKKRLAGLIDRWCLRRAAVVHVTSEAERGWVEEFLRPPEGEAKAAPSGVGAKASVKKRTVRSEENAQRLTLNTKCSSGEAGRMVVVPNGVEVKGFIEPDGSGSRVQIRLAPLVQEREGEEVLKCESSKVLKSGESESTNHANRPNSSFIFHPTSFSREAARTRTVLYLGRLHPLKGLDLLLEAWAEIKGSIAPSALVQEFNRADSAGSKVTNERLAWRLVIAGPDEHGTLKALKEQVVRLGLEESVVFAGPSYGEDKERLMAGADLFVLPTRSENFGIVVAEALAAGVPVITTKGAPWEELMGNEGLNAAGAAGSIGLAASFNRPGGLVQGDANESNDSSFILHPSSLSSNGRCGWWVDVSADPLAEALREAMGLTDAERCAMGKNGRRLVERKYRWEKVAEGMAAIYRACLRG